MASLSESALRRLIKGGETSTVELKLAAPRPVEMAERFCGLANAQGGMVIIGVEDSEQNIIGVPNERMAMTIDTILRAARQNIKPVLVLDPPEPEIYTINGKQVVVATILPNKGAVYQSGGVFWVRRGTHTFPRTGTGLYARTRTQTFPIRYTWNNSIAYISLYFCSYALVRFYRPIPISGFLPGHFLVPDCPKTVVTWYNICMIGSRIKVS